MLCVCGAIAFGAMVLAFLFLPHTTRVVPRRRSAPSRAKEGGNPLTEAADKPRGNGRRRRPGSQSESTPWLLFKDQGYDNTTVEQIAVAAEVSPSTFFRYFPSKEEVVLQDDYDALLIAAFHAQDVGVAAPAGTSQCHP